MLRIYVRSIKGRADDVDYALQQIRIYSVPTDISSNRASAFERREFYASCYWAIA